MCDSALKAQDTCNFTKKTQNCGILPSYFGVERNAIKKSWELGASAHSCFFGFFGIFFLNAKGNP